MGLTANTTMGRQTMGLVTDDVGAFRDAAGETGRLLALDLGTKTIGLAVSDQSRMIASPMTTLKRAKFGAAADALELVITADAVTGLVLGLPLHLDGSSGPRVQATRAFARNLADRIDQPILFWDERLTSAEAERMLIAADTRRAKRAEVIDQIAAAIILQSLLERLAQFSPT